MKDDTCSCTSHDGARSHTLEFSGGYDGFKFPVMDVQLPQDTDHLGFKVGLMQWRWPSGAGYIGSYYCYPDGSSECGFHWGELLKAEPYSSAKREEHVV